MSETCPNSTGNESNLAESVLIEKQALFVKKLAEGGVLIDEGRRIDSSLTPYFITTEKYAKLSHLCELVVGALEKFLRLYVESAEIQKLFPELELHRDLSCIVPTVPRWIHHCRLDLIETPSAGFQLLEVNTGGPVLLWPTILRQIYKADFLPYFQKPNCRIVDQPIDNHTFYIREILRSNDKSLENPNPTIGYLTTSHNRASTDVHLLLKATQELGYNCVAADIQNLQIKNDKLFIEDTPLDLVHLIIDADNNQDFPRLFQNTEDEIKVFLDAVRTNKLVATDSFVSYLVAESKRIVALIQRPQFRKYFTVEENEAIESICPETHSFDNTNRDEFETLFDTFLEDKNEYVIKGASSSKGGKIWLGRDTDVEIWKQLLAKVRDGPYIIQRYVHQTRTKVYNSNPCPMLKDMTTTLAVHVVKGKAVGILTRSSESGIDNATGNNTGLLRAPFVVEQF